MTSTINLGRQAQDVLQITINRLAKVTDRASRFL